MNFALRPTIGKKLIALIALLLVVSLVTVVGASTRLYTQDSTALIQALNADTAGHLATDLQDTFATLMDKMRMLGAVAVQDDKQFSGKAAMLKEFFSSNQEFLSLFVHERDAEGKFRVQTSLNVPELFQSGEAQDGAAWEALSQAKGFSLEEVSHGAVQVLPVQLQGSAVVALAIPFIKSASDPQRFTHTVTALIRESRITAGFTEQNLLGSYLVDRAGRLVAPQVLGKMSAGDSLDHKEIVKALLAGKTNNEERHYVDSVTGELMLGAFHTVGFGGLGVVTEIPAAKAFASVGHVRYQSAAIGLVVLALAFLAGYFFSDSITWPIKQLVQVANRISNGDFEIDLRPKSRDEVAELSLAFNEMASGLKDREFVRETFHKYHDREIAKKILSGSVKLGGERKEVTIFFSDIRGFTSMSEEMAPEAVVEMLNEYMTRMVTVIRKYGGVVDKYVGDAIMAIWGAPTTGPNDPYNAVSACLEMRKELAALNELRLRRRQPVLLIGMGLNSGSVIAGNIGSKERLDYTVIGDVVNLASRVESMTKEFGTDCLVSSSVFQKVESHFVFDRCDAVQVKGKRDAIEVYRVLGYVDSMGAPVIVETPYSTYAASRSDKVVHEAA